jgi:ABC-type multidrug transport system fused ATPase/permease subunit
LARAVYQDNHTIIIDDVLLDLLEENSEDFKKLVSQLLTGIWSEKCLVLVTNIPEIAKHAQNIIFMRNGLIFRSGTQKDFEGFFPTIFN